MSKKTSKHGIKIFPLVDGRTYHTSKLEIHAGVQTDGPLQVDNSTKLRTDEHIKLQTKYNYGPVINKTQAYYCQYSARGIYHRFLKNMKPVPLTISVYGTNMISTSHVPKINKNVLISSLPASTS